MRLKWANHRQDGCIQVLCLLFLAAAILPAAAQDNGGSVAPAEKTEKRSALQAVISGVSDFRTRLVNTISVVSWPVLPQGELDSELGNAAATLTKRPAVTIKNAAFVQRNAGSTPELPNSALGQAIMRTLAPGPPVEGGTPAERDTKEAQLFFQTALSRGASVQEALEATVDYRRVREILRLRGADLRVSLEGKEKAHPDLLWEFTPYVRQLPGGTLYRYGVRVRSEDLKLTLDPAEGKKQTLQFVMKLLPGPHAGVVEQSTTSTHRVEGGKEEAGTAETEQQGGIGEDRPLLTDVRLPSLASLSPAVSNAILASGRASAISGILSARGRNEMVSGVNVTLPSAATKDGALGMTAGVAKKSRLFVGPSISLGDGLLILSVGSLLGGQDKDTDKAPGKTTGRIAGLVSLDLSRLLFGKPRASEGPRAIEFEGTAVGQLTSRRIVGTRGILLIEGGLPDAAVVQFNGPSSGTAMGQQTLNDKGSLYLDLDPGKWSATAGGVPLNFEIRPGEITRQQLGGGSAGPSPTSGGEAPAVPKADPATVPASHAVPAEAGTATTGGNLRIRVVADDDEALFEAREGATVQVFSAVQAVLVDETRTGRDGWAVLKVPPGEYRIQVSLRGFQQQSLTLSVGGEKAVRRGVKLDH